MPVQTTLTGYISFPDGAKVSVKADGESSYTDIGAINSAINCVLNYEENQVTTANAGKLAKQIREMTTAIDFTLINLNPANINRLGGDIFTLETSNGDAVSDIENQTISGGWSDNTLYNLVLDSTAEGEIKTASQPTLTSVTLDPDTAAEVLVEDADYVVVETDNSPSGWAIQFISGNMDTASPTALDIQIVYGSNAPIASSTIYAGSSTETLSAYAIKFSHTNDSDAIDRELEIYAADTNSGGFAFNFKGANEDGVEEMPLSITGKIDTTRDSGKQLMRYFQLES